MIKYWFFILFTISFSLNLWAQGSIKGQIIDEQKESIPFATIALYQKGNDSTVYRVQITDTLGQFIFSNIPFNKYYLKAQFTGYNNYNSPVIQLNSSEFTLETIVLEPTVENLEGVEIKVKTPVIKKTPRGLVVEVAKSPVLTTGSTKDVLPKIPGVVMNIDGSLTLKGKQGVRVFIDGKRTYMSLEQVMQYLESLPATDIENIEVYDTPPARFDAEGAGGIINIVLKNGAALGFNGMVGLNTGYGNYHKFVPWGNFNYRNKKFNVFGSGWLANNKWSQIYDYTAIIPLTDSTETGMDATSEKIFFSKGGGGRVGVNYKPTQKQTIGLVAFANTGNWDALTPSNTYINNTLFDNYDQVIALNNRIHPWWGTGVNTNYEYKFSSQKILTVDADFIMRGNEGLQRLNNEYLFDSENIGKEITDIDNETDIRIMVAKADYTTNLNEKWKLETGGKISDVVTKNSTIQSNGQSEDVLVYDSLRSNEFEYKENIYAGYFSFMGTVFKKVEADIGLRAEYTFSEGNSITIDSTTTRNYLNLFPNMAFKYKLTKDFDASLSYARRLNRPPYWRLNPFEIQDNQFNYTVGNPYLQPQYSNSFSGGLGYKSSVFLTLSYTNTTDAITEVLEQDEAQQLTYYTAINLNTIENYSANLVLPIPITKWWVFRFNGTVFFNHQTSTSNEGFIDNALWSYTLNGQNYFSLPKNINLELGGYYNSAVFWNTLYVDPHYQIDFGASYKYKKFNFRLSFQDFLNIRESYGWVRQGNVNRNYYYKGETRKIMLSVNYRFGNQKVKGARKRKSASEDLQQRGNSPN
ncbi:MAG: TonB-dependent receptor [Cytophagales bacterium]|nr:TonB-dependent receptor [Cytophagales bacterium]